MVEGGWPGYEVGFCSTERYNFKIDFTIVWQMFDMAYCSQSYNVQRRRRHRSIVERFIA